MPSRNTAATTAPRSCFLHVVLTGLITWIAGPAQALDQREHSPGVHDTQLRQCYENLPVDPARSVALAQEILSDPEHTLVARIRALTCLSGAEGVRGNAAESRANAYQAIEILEAEAPNLPDFETAGGYNAIANALAVINDWPMAMELSERSLAIGTRLGHVGAQIAALSRIAHINIDYQEDYEAAEKRLRDAIALASATDQRGIEVLVYNLGYSLFKAGRLDDARNTLDNALAMIRTPTTNAPRNVSIEMRTLAYLAAIKAAHGQVDQGISELTDIIQRQGDLPDTPAEASSRTLLGNVLLNQGRAQETLAQADTAIDLATRGRFHREQRDALTLRASALAALGQAQEALDARDQAHRLHVDALIGTTLGGLASMRTKINQASDDIVSRRDALLIVLRNILIIAGALLLAFLLFTQARTSREFTRLRKSDPLTGLLNRHSVTQHLDALSRDTAANPVGPRTSHALFLIDIDNFKTINERFGSRAGDEVIKAIALRLRDASGVSGIAARWSGDEFLLALPCNDMAEGRREADRLHTALTGAALAPASVQQQTLSISMGFASFPFFPGDSLHTWQDCLPLADQALSAAKQTGGNAWVGIWGNESGNGTPLHIIRGSTDRAQIKGWIEVATSKGIDQNDLLLDRDGPASFVMRPMHDPALP